MSAPDVAPDVALGAPREGTAAAADPARSVWVAANAGTGKTRVLIDRLSRLLLAGAAPSRILCLTFTKAAAAEMANRLGDRLGQWSAVASDRLTAELAELLGRAPTEDEIAAARRLFARVLDSPEGLRIRTIHSFCESLLGRFPLESGIPPHFSVIDEGMADELRAEARDRVLIRTEASPGGALARAFGRVAGFVEEGGLGRLLRELDVRRGDFRGRIAEGVASACAAVYAALGLDPADDDRSVVVAVCAAAAFDGDGLARAARALEAGSKADRARARTILEWLGAGGRRPELFGEYEQVFLTKDQEPRARLAIKAVLATAPEAEGILRTEQQRLLGVLDRRRAVATAEATEALVRIGAAIAETYDDLKRARGLLDYDDLVLVARRLLESGNQASWVHYKLDGGIDHILVDEAQDTNPDQWRAVAALAAEFFAGEGRRDAPRTVFAVGDEKQSIFSFQGADPQAFERMREHFAGSARAAGQAWLDRELTHSYRSTEAVLRVVDRVFADEEARQGLTAAGHPVRHQTTRQGQAGVVEIWPTVMPAEGQDALPWDAPLDQMSAESPPLRLARAIAERIAAWLDDGERLPSADRPLRPGDIMILVRRRTRFVEALVRCLKERGVPVAGRDRMRLTDQIAVMDLMAFGRFALLPEDDLNLAAVLKSPLVGFDDEALFRLARGRRGSLWSELKARRDEEPGFAAAFRRLSETLALADYVPPFEFYAHALGRDGDRKRLLARLGPDAADPLEEFLTLALEFERAHAPSLQGFLHWLAAGEAEVKRDLDLGRGEVRIMTVHGAKGLQANVVILPDTCAVPDARLADRILWPARDDRPVMLWPPFRDAEPRICAELRAAARARALGEYRRLLYVAMTRARDRLYVCGWQTKAGRDPGCWYDRVLAGVQAIGAEITLPNGEKGWRIEDPQSAPPDGAEIVPPEPSAEAGLPDWIGRPPPAEPRPPRPLAPSRPEAEEPAVRSPLGDDGGQRFRRGRLVHRLLELLPEIAPESRQRAGRAFLAERRHGLSSEVQGEILRETLAVIDDPAFAPLFGPESRAEVPLAGVVNGRAIAGQTDRLLVGADAVTVVDFKSDRQAPRRIGDVPSAYLGQMAAYREILGLVYPGRRIRCALLWTDGPLLMVLPDEALNRYLP